MPDSRAAAAQGHYRARLPDFIHELNMMNLVPLPLAARHVYLCVEGYAPNARLNDRFNRLGRLMASLGGLYVVEGPEGTPRPLSREELARGLFKAGADVLVTHDCIERAIDALRNPVPDALSLAAA